MPLQHVMTAYSIIWCVQVNRYSLMDIPCTGVWPSPPRYRRQPVWHRLTWQPQPHLSQQPPTVQPLCLLMWGFAWEEIANVKVCQHQKWQHALNFCYAIYLDTTFAAADLRAFTASECVSSATAERMKPSSSVNTVTELDFLPTPKTCKGAHQVRIY